MRKWCLFLSAYLCLCLLAACASFGGGAADGGGSRDPLPGDAGSGEPTAPTTVVCRVVSAGADGSLLLAERDGGDVYRVSTGGLRMLTDGVSVPAAEARCGMLVEAAYSGTVLETFPAQLSGVSELRQMDEAGFDDRCVLYGRVLEDLWVADPGLNGGITEVGVDLSATCLSESEQAAVAWAFGEAHGMVPLQGTYDQLVDQGYITGEALEGMDALFWQWTDGCLFSIVEKPAKEGDGPMAVTFDAQKWRSGLGAYFFSDCTAAQSAAGVWSGYQVGAEAIS